MEITEDKIRQIVAEELRKVVIPQQIVQYYPCGLPPVGQYYGTPHYHGQIVCYKNPCYSTF